MWTYLDSYQKRTFLVINVRKRLNTPARKNQLKILNEAVNSGIYINECLQKRFLASFHLWASHSLKLYFWHDLAGCHYSKRTIDWIDENSNFVPKEINPPNFPRHVRLRILGAVWHKKLTREANKEQQLIRCIESKMKEFGTHFVQRGSRQKSDL